MFTRLSRWYACLPAPLVRLVVFGLVTFVIVWIIRLLPVDTATVLLRLALALALVTIILWWLWASLRGGWFPLGWWLPESRAQTQRNDHRLDPLMADAMEKACRRMPGFAVPASGSAPPAQTPWYLVLGDDEAATDGLLRTAGHGLTTLPASENALSEVGWRWWLLDKVVLIELAQRLFEGALVGQSVPNLDAPLASVLAKRGGRSLDGILLVFSVQAFERHGGPDEALIQRCRLLQDVLSRGTIEPVPVYVVLTGLESLEGVDTFVHRLGSPRTRQVAGVFRPATAEGAAGVVPAQAVAALRAGFDAMRLEVIDPFLSASEKQRVFEFGRRLSRLWPALAQALNGLAASDPYLKAGAVAGVGVTAAGGHAAFIDDLFHGVLGGTSKTAPGQARETERDG